MKVKNITQVKYNWKEARVTRYTILIEKMNLEKMYLMESGIDIVNDKELDYVVIKVYLHPEEER